MLNVRSTHFEIYDPFKISLHFNRKRIPMVIRPLNITYLREQVTTAYLDRVSLSATGFYK